MSQEILDEVIKKECEIQNLFDLMKQQITIVKETKSTIKTKKEELDRLIAEAKEAGVIDTQGNKIQQ